MMWPCPGPGRAGVSGGGGDPSQIPGLKLWLEADTLALADGAAVVTWPDVKSGSGNVATATGPALFAANALNGKPLVNVNGSFLELATPIPGTGAWTVVSLFIAYFSGAQFFSLGSSTPNGPCGSRAYNDGTLFIHALGGIYNCGLTPSGYHVFSGTSTPTMHVDGVARSPAYAFAGAAGNFSSVGGEMGSLTGGSGGLVGVIMFDHVSDTDRAIAENYFRNKYALTGFGIRDTIETGVKREVIKRGLAIVTLPEFPE